MFLTLSRMFIAALWSSGKMLTSWFLLMMFIVFVLLSHVVSWVRCGTWLYRFLIFDIFLSYMTVMKQRKSIQLIELETVGQTFKNPLKFGLLWRMYWMIWVVLGMPSNKHNCHASDIYWQIPTYTGKYEQIWFTTLEFYKTLHPTLRLVISIKEAIWLSILIKYMYQFISLS